MNNTLIVIGAIILLGIGIFVISENPKDPYTCRLISNKAIISEQQIIVDDTKCSFSPIESNEIKFEYEDQITSQDQSGQQIKLELSCHKTITEKISPIGISYGPENEKYALGPNGQIYFCMPTIRV